LITLETQAKFVKVNIPELKIDYHKRNIKLPEQFQPPQPQFMLDRSNIDQRLEDHSDNDTFDEFD